MTLDQSLLTILTNVQDDWPNSFLQVENKILTRLRKSGAKMLMNIEIKVRK